MSGMRFEVVRRCVACGAERDGAPNTNTLSFDQLCFRCALAVTPADAPEAIKYRERNESKLNA